jgi:hypothetical protein
MLGKYGKACTILQSWLQVFKDKATQLREFHVDYTSTSFFSQSLTVGVFLRRSMVWPSASSLRAWASTPPGYFSFSSPFDFSVRQ